VDLVLVLLDPVTARYNAVELRAVARVLAAVRGKALLHCFLGAPRERPVPAGHAALPIRYESDTPRCPSVTNRTRRVRPGLPGVLCGLRPPPPPPRTKWTRRVPHPVLIGHAASHTSIVHLNVQHKCCTFSPSRRPPPPPVLLDTSRPSSRTNWTRLVPPPVLNGHASRPSLRPSPLPPLRRDCKVAHSPPRQAPHTRGRRRCPLPRRRSRAPWRTTRALLARRPRPSTPRRAGFQLHGFVRSFTILCAF
jgi:hypothetical protein